MYESEPLKKKTKEIRIDELKLDLPHLIRCINDGNRERETTDRNRVRSDTEIHFSLNTPTKIHRKVNSIQSRKRYLILKSIQEMFAFLSEESMEKGR